MLVLELCRVGSEQIQGNPTPPATTHYPTSITQECTTQTMTMTMTMMVMKDERDMKFNIGGCELLLGKRCQVLFVTNNEGY